MGEYTSIDVQNGLPIISYYDRTNTALKVADCRDFVCGDADIRTLRGAAGIFSESVGRHTSITIGEDDLPIISYYNAGPDSVDVIHCEDTGCTEFIDESPWVTLDRHTVGIISPLSRRDVGLHTSIAIGPDGSPVISYYDASADDLKVAWCFDIECSRATISVGQYSSIGIGDGWTADRRLLPGGHRRPEGGPLSKAGCSAP